MIHSHNDNWPGCGATAWGYTCASTAAWPTTPYYYSTYDDTENEAVPSTRRKIIIFGSGPNRIGHVIEFDYTSVHAIWTLQEEGDEVIMVNSNPETGSTDYDICSRIVRDAAFDFNRHVR